MIHVPTKSNSTEIKFIPTTILISIIRFHLSGMNQIKITPIIIETWLVPILPSTAIQPQSVDIKTCVTSPLNRWITSPNMALGSTIVVTSWVIAPWIRGSDSNRFRHRLHFAPGVPPAPTAPATDLHAVTCWEILTQYQPPVSSSLHPNPIMWILVMTISNSFQHHSRIKILPFPHWWRETPRYFEKRPQNKRHSMSFMVQNESHSSQNGHYSNQ